MKSFAVIISFIFYCSGSAAQQLPVAKLISESIKAHEQAENFLEWEQHPLNPNQLVTSILSNKKYTNEEICQAFLNLTPEDFLLFYDAVKNSFLADSLPCKKVLITRTDIWLKNYQNMLLQKTMELDLKPKQDNFKTEVKYIDPTHGPHFVQGDLPLKTLSFTFDDGPSSSYTHSLLDIFDEYGLRVNFFSLGKNIVRLQPLTQEVQRRGHLIGNHSWNHLQMNKLNFADAKNEILNTFDALANVVPHLVPFFRYPYGASTKTINEFLKNENIPSFLWNIDTLDWKYKNPEYLLQFALKEIHKEGSGIILFHDIQPQTLAIMPALLYQLKSEGYKTVVFDSIENIPPPK